MNKPHATIRDGSVSVLIYRETRENGAFRYRVAWQEGGRRQRRGFTDEPDARSFARERARSLAELGSAVLTLSGDESRLWRSMVRAAEGFGLSLDSAFAEWQSAREKLTGNGTIAEAVDGHLARGTSSADSPTVSEAVSAYLSAKRAANRSGRHLEDLETRLGLFGRTFSGRIGTVTLPGVLRWLGSIPHVGPRSRRNYRDAVRALVRFSERKGWVAKGKIDFADVERESEPVGEITVFTPDELATILARCRRELLPFILLGAGCGIRHAELGRLSWAEIHFDEHDEQMPHGWVEVKAAQSKNAAKLRGRARRLVPLSAGLRESLLRLREDAAAPVCSFVKADNQITKLAAASGVAWKNNALRHSFASYRMALIGDAGKVAYELGNSQSMVFAHYRAVVTPAEAKRWFAALHLPAAPLAAPRPLADGG